MKITRRQAQEALDEIEFDRATGKLSAADYAELRTTYEGVLAANPKIEAPPDATTPPSLRDFDAEAEAMVRRVREGGAACPECGPRPESDALFCSTCGRALRA
jgi:hypothetical protein